MKRDRVELYKLEDRVLFEAAAMDQAAEAENINENSAESQAESAEAAESDSTPETIENFASVELPPEAIAETASDDSNGDSEKILVVVNPSVAESGKIVNDLGENYEILQLESGTDALDFINAYLDTHADTEYSALHIISHGNEGYFTLGSERIDNSTLNPADWKAIGEHLSDDADILIYGCDIAKSQDGKALIQNIAGLTGADVAASADSTGAEGNWDLEYQAGLIEAATLAPSAESPYDYTLSNTATITVTAGTDKILITSRYDADTGYDGAEGITSREAIYMAQNHADYAGKDITITFSDTLEEIIVGGDGGGQEILISSGNIVIDGALGNGENILMIRDTNAFLHAQNATVTWQNLILRNADPTVYTNSTWDLRGNAVVTLKDIRLETPSQIAWATSTGNTLLVDGLHVTGDVQKSSLSLLSTATSGDLELIIRDSVFENLYRDKSLLDLSNYMKINCTIENSVFRNNVIEKTVSASGVSSNNYLLNFSNRGNLAIRDTEFRGNSVGGSLFNINATGAEAEAELSGNLFVNNSATDKIMNLAIKKDLVIRDSYFVGNTNPTATGSLSKTEDQMITMGNGSFVFLNNMFAHNSGFYKLVAGGNSSSHSLSIDGCTFLENSAGELLTSESTAKHTLISNSLFSRNSASSLVCWFGGKVTLLNSTFMENSGTLTFNGGNKYVYNTLFDTTGMNINGSYSGGSNLAGSNVKDGLAVLENTGIQWDGKEIAYLDADGDTQILSGVAYLVRSDNTAAAVSGTAVELAEKDGIIYYSLDGGTSWKLSANAAASVTITDADKLTGDVNGLTRPAVQQVLGADSRLLDVSAAPVSVNLSGSFEYGIYGAEKNFTASASVTLGTVTAAMDISLLPDAAPNGEGFYNAGGYDTFTLGSAAVTAEGYNISAVAADGGYMLTVTDTAGTSAPLYYFVAAAVSDAASVTVTQKTLGTVTPEFKLNGAAAGSVSTDNLADLEITANPESASGVPLKLVLVNSDGTTSDFVATDLRGGTYTVRYEWSDAQTSANYSATFGTAELTVIAGSLNVTVTSSDADNTAVYGGDGITLTGVAVGGTGDYSYQWYMYDADGNAAAVAGATGNTLTITDVNQSGKYYLSVSTTDGGNAVSGDTEIAITPLDVTVNIYANTSSVFYTGAAHSLSGYTMSISSDLYAESNVSFNGTAEDMTVTRTDAGTSSKVLTAEQFTLADNDNFNVDLVIQADTMRLTVANAVIKVSSPAVSVYYTGTPHTFNDLTVTTVNNQTATVEYSVDGGKTYSTEKPEFTEMGVTKVYYRVNAPNHTVLYNTFNMTVKEAASTVVNTLTDDAFDGKTSFTEALACVNSGTVGENAVITFDAEAFKDNNVITLTKQTNITNALKLTKSVTIDGYLDEDTNIEINGNGGFIFGTVEVAKGQDYTIKNISFTNAKGTNGAVFKLASASATAADHAEIVFDNVTMHDITTGGTGDGGLIAGRGSKYVDWEFRDTVFFNIEHKGAGAVFDLGAANSASYNTILLERCLFDSTRTSSMWGGGAFSVVYADIVVKDSTFINCKTTHASPTRGALMTLEGAGSFLMENSTSVNNTAYHGIILHEPNKGGIQILNSVFYGNEVTAPASTNAAIIFGKQSSNSHVTVANSVFLENTTKSGSMLSSMGTLSAYNNVYDGTLANKDLTFGDGSNKTGEGWTMADLYAGTDLVMGTDGDAYTPWDGSSAGHLDSITDTRIYFAPAENSPLLNSGVQVAADSATMKRDVFIKTGDTWTSITYDGTVTENAAAPADELLLAKDMLGNSLSYTDDTGTYYAAGNIQTKQDAVQPPAETTITVNFSGNAENTGTMASQTITSGTGSVTFTNTFTFDGWTFMGFDTEAAFTADSTLDYAASGNTVTLTDAQAAALLGGGQDVTLYAIWKKDIAITYATADGTAAPDNVNVTIYNGAGYEWTAPAISSAPADWTALGWRTDSTAGDAAYTAGEKEIFLTNMAFNAVYSRTVTIAYDGNGADNSMSDTGTVQYRNVNTASPVTLNIAENTLTRGGYTFKGWSLTGDGAVISETSFTVSGTDASARTLYAVWEQDAAAGDTPSLTVTTADDVVDAADGLISLREAIAYAAADADGKLAVDGKHTIQFSLAKDSVIAVDSVLNITAGLNITIDGDADGDGIGDIILDGGNTYEGKESLNTGTAILKTASGSDVTLRNLTFRNGYAAGGSTGGAVTNAGTLTIQSTLFRDNYAEYSGGAIFSTGTLYVEDTTFYRNQGEGDGGAVGLGSTSKAVIVNTTFAENGSPKSGAGAISGGNGAALYLLNNVFDGQTVHNGRENIGNSPSTANSAMYYCVYYDAHPRGNGGYSTMDGNLNTAYDNGKATLTTVAVRGSLLTESLSNNALVTTAQAQTNGTLVGKIGNAYYYLDHTDADSANWKWVNVADTDTTYQYDGSAETFGLGAGAEILKFSQNGVDRTADMTEFSAGAYQRFLQIQADDYVGVADGTTHTVNISVKTPDNSPVTITYKGTGESAFDETPPEYTAPGSYTVEYVITGTQETIAGTLTVTLYAPLVVNTDQDPADFVLTDSEVSLREAISIVAGNPDAYRFISFAEDMKGKTILLSDTLTVNGAVFTLDGDVDGDGIGDIVLDGGRADNAGGVQLMNIDADSNITLRNLVLQNGYSTADGGAVSNAGTLLIQKTLLQGSHADGNGGAVYNSGTLAVEDSTFYHNTTSKKGGAIATIGATAAVNTTFAENTAASNAGAISALSKFPSMILVNNVFDGNKGGSRLNVGDDPSQTASALVYNVYNGSGTMDGNFGSANNHKFSNSDSNTNLSLLTQPAEFENGAVITTGNALTSGTLVGKIGNAYYYLDHTDADSANWKWVNAGEELITYAYSNAEADGYGLGASAVILSESQNGADRTEDMTAFAAGSYSVGKMKEILLYTVSADNTETSAGSFHTIQEAVDAAVSGTEYVIRFNSDYFTPGNYTLTPDSTVTIADGLNITIDGDVDGDGTADMILDGGRADNAGGIQIMNIASGSTVTVQNLTFRNAYSETNGGAVYNAGTLTLTNVDFLKNSALTGGGAIYTEGTLNVNDGSFEGNMVTGTGKPQGGAIFLNKGTLTVDGTEFTGNGNGKGWGGGIYTDTRNATVINISNALFEENKGAIWGAALYAEHATVSIDNTVFKGNTGANTIYSNADLTVDRSKFISNTGAGEGGAIEAVGNTVISNSSFTGNNGSWGAAVYFQGKTTKNAVIINSEFLDNGPGGKAIYSERVFTAVNTTIANNSAGAIHLWYNTAGANLVNCILAGNGSTDVYLNSGASTPNLYYSVYSAANNINADANSMQKAAADVYTDYTADAGFQPVNLTGDAARKGTLVGKIGNAFYYKSGDQWLKVGGTDADAIAFTADAATNYGLGTADGTEVYTADLNGVSRVGNLNYFSMGAYSVEVQASELTVSVSANDAEGDTADGKATYGNTVTLTATVSGGDPGTSGYTYQWYNGDGAVDGATGATLTLRDAADSGSYYVVVTDSAGTKAGTQDSAQEVQIQKAVITVKVENMTAIYGDAAGIIKYTYDGFKNGETAATAAGFKDAVTASAYKQGDNVGSYALTASGAEAENYSFTYENGTLRVDKRNATISLKREYDGTTAFAATAVKDADYTGNIYGDDAAGLTVSKFDVESADVTTIYQYVSSIAAVTGDKAGNYNFTVMAMITKYSGEILITVTGNTAEKIYSGAEQKSEGYNVEISNSLYTADDFTFSGTAVAKGTDAGSYAMGLTAAMFANSSQNFSNVKFAVTDGGLTVEKATVTVKVEGNHTGGTYNGQAYTATGYTVKEIVNNSAAAYTANDFTFNGTASVSRTDAGKSVMGLTAAMFANSKTKNYDVTFEVTDGYVEVAKKQLTLGADMFTVSSKVYDGDTDMKGETSFDWGSQVVSGDQVDLTFTATLNSKNVADAKQVTFSGFSINDSNYELKSTADVVKAQAGLVTKKAVTVEWTGGNQFSWVYDGKANKPEAALETGVTGETATVTVDTYSGDTAGTYSDAGTYTAKAVIAGIDLNNYNVQKDSITYTITQAQAVLSGIAVRDNLIYDSEAVTAGTDAAQDLAVSVSGVAGAAAPTGAVTWKFYTDAAHANEIAAPEDAGTYYVVATLAADKNYLGTSVDGTFTIARKDMTVDFEREYDGTDKFSGITVTDPATGLCGGDEVTIADFATGNRNAGEYKDLTAAAGGSDAANYNITVNAVISKYSGEIVVEITGNSVTDYVYNGMEQRVEGYTHTISNSLYTTQDFTFSGSDVIAEKNAGSYNMGLAADQFANNSGNFANVKFNVADGQMVISPKEATITANSASKIYDGTALTEKGFTTDGFVDGEGIKSAVIKGTQTEVGSSPNKIVSYVFADGTLASNYIITEIRGTLTVQPSGDTGSNRDTLQGAPGQSSVNTGIAVNLGGTVSSTEAQRPGGRNYLMAMEHQAQLSRFEQSALSVNGHISLDELNKVIPLSVIEQRMMEDMKSPEIGTVECGETAVSDKLNGDDVLEQFFNHTEDELEMKRLKELLRNVSDYSFSELDLDSLLAKSEQFKDEIDLAIEEMLTV